MNGSEIIRRTPRKHNKRGPFLALVLCYINCTFLSFKHPVQVARWPSNFAPGIKTKFKYFSGEMQKKKKNEIQRGQLIFHRGAKQKLCLKNAEIP